MYMNLQPRCAVLSAVGLASALRNSFAFMVHPFGYAYGLLPTDNRVTQSRHDAPCGAAASR